MAVFDANNIYHSNIRLILSVKNRISVTYK